MNIYKLKCYQNKLEGIQKVALSSRNKAAGCCCCLLWIVVKCCNKKYSHTGSNSSSNIITTQKLLSSFRLQHTLSFYHLRPTCPMNGTREWCIHVVGLSMSYPFVTPDYASLKNWPNWIRYCLQKHFVNRQNNAF